MEPLRLGRSLRKGEESEQVREEPEKGEESEQVWEEPEHVGRSLSRCGRSLSMTSDSGQHKGALACSWHRAVWF